MVAMVCAARAFVWSLTVLSILSVGLGHDSCCAKAAMVGESEVTMVPDMNARKPEDWDDEEDGPWERPLIPKPPDAVVTIFFRDLLNTLEDASPWLLLGLLLSGVVKAVTPTSFAQQMRGSGGLPLAKGAFLGLMSPLCSCSALPMALGLVTAGASPGAAVAFVVSAQAAGVDSLLFTVGILGLRCAIARTLAAGLLGMAAGFVTPSGANGLNRSSKRMADPDACPSTSGSWLQCVGRGLQEALTDDFDEIAPSLMLGFSIASLLAALLPAGGLAQIALLGGLWGRASAIAVALPLQFCEHASVPLAVALQKAGATGGLSFAVLASLPAINSASIALVAQLAGLRAALQVLLMIWLCGISLSYIADFANAEVVQVGHSHDGLPQWFVYISKPLMGVIASLSVWRLSSFGTATRATGCSGCKGCKEQ
ncbi:unnamed protein product [Cladocopium goreaui]|uniref:Permease n=1 Tax=Cladocopium goreaui TaxID=2562237 RepID=A0A9P1GL44_9DINO|nr:unnamed protein product [Cladocopium goreaui]